LAREVVVELLGILRESGYFTPGGIVGPREALDRAFQQAKHQFTSDGHINWFDSENRPPWELPSVTPPKWTPPGPPAATQTPPPSLVHEYRREVVSPDIPLLLSSLRRLTMGALRPFITRRRNHQALSFDDEYDMQDAVEVLLRTLYSDVRAEEPTPSSAGSSSRMDLHIRQASTAVEVKVTRPGRGREPVKGEILRDINDYRNHPHVRVLIVAVYDLADTFENPAGFEGDLSGQHNGLEVHVLVVPWVGPRRPPGA
jgi:hypothetical protein